MRRSPLPIDEALPRLRAALATHPRVVLQAPPGAGKTTAVPPALLGEPWNGGRIVMLEPRRLAARAAARRMAAVLGESPGGTVGFRIRGDAAIGPATRIEVVTEGILTRMLTDDPTLEGVACVIFDEYHERSVVADTGLALALHSAELVRPDLRILVMSATLDGDAVARLLGGAPVVDSPGRAHPVDTRWLPPRAGSRPLDGVVPAIRRALEETDGDVLVFLPGAGEIHRIRDALDPSALPGRPRVYALHGTMPAEEQDAAIAPSPAGERKVVLATSVAETSLTIEGVRAVVDCGLARVPRFDAGSGMTRLETVRVSRDAADQRRGRAGRTAPGVCYRLWSEAEHEALLAHRAPEILSADLAPLALELTLAGVDDPAALRWLDRPPAAAMARARELLTELEMIDSAGRVTRHGRHVAGLGLHPRLGHMAVRGAERGAARLAAELAALLGDRDVLRGDAAADPDVTLRLSALRGDGAVAPDAVDRGRVARARDEARRVAARLERGTRRADAARAGGSGSGSGRSAGARSPEDGDETAAELLALAFPDRVGLARGRGRFRLRNGRGAVVPDGSPLARAAAIAVAETDGARDDARVFLAAALDPAAVQRLFGDQVVVERESRFDEAAGSVVTATRRVLGALVLEERQVRGGDPEATAAAFAQRVRERGLAAVPWSDAGRLVRERLAFAHTLDDAWPDVSDEALLLRLEEWFTPLAAGARRWDDLADAEVGAALLSLAGPGRRRALDALAPTHVVVATGSRVPVNYADPAAPAIAVRLQELFGTDATPTVGGGRVPLTIQLLSPAGRPIQVTRDLGRFWRGSYAEVRKEMRGRYPRHEWPEDPLAAAPTRRAKPRGPRR
ncbi:MAG: ATP-dependent helicase HrpB [Gemmatimonadota bacterium]|nr:ATP-dependent helicase HrpB [Gemmatimonadota bacterium]